MAWRVFVCSRDDVVTRIHCEDGWTETGRVLEGVPVRCVAADGDRVIAGTQGAGALLSRDGRGRWERIELPERRSRRCRPLVRLGRARTWSGAV